MMNERIFRAGQIWCGDDVVLANGYVVVDAHGRVKDVGTGVLLSIADGKDFGDNATLLPGLIDLHVHLVWDGSAHPRGKAETESSNLMVIRAANHARQTLMDGVTAVRDVGGPYGVPQALAQAQRLGLIQAPYIVAAGQAIMMTGGHGWSFGREADGIDGVRKAVRQAIKEGAEVIKVMATGGVYTEGEKPGQSQLGVEEMTVAVEEAHKRGLRVAAHAEGREGIRNAVLAGVDTIEHGCFLDDDTAALMAERGTYYVPTVAVFTQMARAGKDSGIPDYVLEKSRWVAEATWEAVKRAKRYGVKIAGGTDAGSPLHPHSPLPLEVAMLVECGLSPVDALSAATATSADALDVEGITGRIAPGAFADMVAVQGDPLDDVRALSHVKGVVQHGRLMG